MGLMYTGLFVLSCNGFSFPLCVFHVMGLARLALRSKACFLLDATVLFRLDVAVNLNGVAGKYEKYNNEN